MTFLHPWAIWIGAFAAAGPVVVHLLTRPRPVKLPLSTLRFVREAVRARRARHRLRDLIVLAARTLAILLLALAVAQPQWGPQPLVSDREQGDAVRVVILDVSQSMAATEGGIEAVERAKNVAADYLHYRPGLSANLILAGAEARSVFDGPSTNFDALRDALSGCRARPERLAVNAAIEKAARMLSLTEDDQRRRELVVVSDFQRASWGSADFSVLHPDVNIQLQPPDPAAPAKAPENLAILGAEAYTQSSNSRSVQLRVVVGNFTQAERKVNVEVAVGETTCRLSEVCPAGRSTSLTEGIELRQIGWQSGEARLVGVDDALAADNVRPLVVRTRPRPVYALITRRSASAFPSSSWYLKSALAPDFSQGERASVEVRPIDPTDLDAAALAPASLIALDHPGKLSPEVIELLADLMRRSRPIIYVTGETIDAANLQQLGDAAGSGFRLPVEVRLPPAGEFRRDLKLADMAFDDGVFGRLGRDFERECDSLRFAGGLDLRPLADSTKGEILASYDDGSVGVMLARFTGSPAHALAVINADLGAMNVGNRWETMALVGELLAEMLEGHRSEPAYACGEALQRSLPGEVGSSAGLRIVGPGMTDSQDAGQSLLRDEAAGVQWIWHSPQQPGVYQVVRGDATVFALAVGVPAEESDLDRLAENELKELTEGVGRSMYFHGKAGSSDRSDDSWKWFAVGCVVCMLGEITALLGFRA
ncbi:MAG TPA: VWA domain-containing protein [Thermoguttaceae bacterium]|nr:VWA domain-containing protein [Thermoguttaceae bacterium]